MKRLMLLLVVLSLLMGTSIVWAQGQLIPGNRTIAGTFNAGLATGPANAYVLTLNPAITAYVADQAFHFRVPVANTGPSTLAVNTAGVKTLKKWSAGQLVDLAAGDLRVNQEVHVLYDGTVMQVLSLGGGSASAVGPVGTLQASNGAQGLAAFGGSLCSDPARPFMTGLGSTGAAQCAVPPSSAALSAHVLTDRAEPGLANAVNLGAQSSGIVATIVSGGIASVQTRAAPTGALVGTDDVQELDGKRVNVRTVAVNDATPVTLNLSTTDVAYVSELSQATLFANPIGVAKPGQWLRLQVHSTVPRALTWATFWTTAPGFPLPTTTSGGSVYDTFLFQYNPGTGTFDLIYNSQLSTLTTPTGVTPGTYACPVDLTVDARGRVMSVSNGSCAGGGGSAAAGSDGDIQFKLNNVLAADTTGKFNYSSPNHTLLLQNLRSSAGGSYQTFRDGLGHTGYLLTSPLSQPRGWLMPDEDGQLCVKGGSCGGGAGGVAIVGTPTAGQVAEWASSGSIQGVTATGSGSLVRATNPVLVGPDLGTPSAVVLTSATGLPLTSGVTGRLGYGNLTAATAEKLLMGRGAGAGGNWQEIALGTGLVMTGTTLSATGSVTTDTAQRATFYNTTTSVAGAPGLTFDTAGNAIASAKLRSTPKNASATLGPNDGPIVPCTSGAIDATFTLPAASSTTQGEWSIIKVDTGLGRCLVIPAGSDTFNYGTTAPLVMASVQGARVDVRLASTTNWTVLATVDQLDLTTDITGVLPIANGGTGTASILTGVMRGSATGMTAAELSGVISTSGSNVTSMVDSRYIPARSLDVEGSCALGASAVLVTTGPKLPTITCTDTNTDGIDFEAIMPDGWNGGTVVVKLAGLYAGTPTAGQLFSMNFSGQCVRSGDPVAAWAITSGATATSSSNVAATLTMVATANLEYQGTSSALTLSGTCAGGSHIFVHGLVNATTTNITTIASLKILGVKVEFTRNASD